MWTEQEEKNLRAVPNFYEVIINGRQYERAGQSLDDNYFQHKAEAETGTQGVLDFVRSVYDQAPLRKARTVRSSVDGDYVILRVHITNAAEAPNLAVIDVFRAEDGKLMEHWDVASAVPETAGNANGVF